MVDIHCHLLPGLDDGAESMAMSLKMTEMAIADGVTRVIATPHSSNAFPFVPENVRARRDELQSLVGPRLAISTGCDFHLSFENLEALRANRKCFTLNQTEYLLIEFDDFAIPASVEDTLHQIRLLGLQPIITHPERNALIRSQWDRFFGWLRQGCLVQVTAQSLTGGFGRRAQQATEFLLDSNAIHFIASDAHNDTSRPLRLKPAFDLLAEGKGAELASALFEKNPRAVFEGRALPFLPETRDWNMGGKGRKQEPAKRRFRFF